MPKGWVQKLASRVSDRDSFARLDASNAGQIWAQSTEQGKGRTIDALRCNTRDVDASADVHGKAALSVERIP